VLYGVFGVPDAKLQESSHYVSLARTPLCEFS
jgi:hypothetical protein